MSKDGKKRGEVKDEELRGVSAGGLKSPITTPSKDTKKSEPAKKGPDPKMGLSGAPTPPKK